MQTLPKVVKLGLTGPPRPATLRGDELCWAASPLDSGASVLAFSSRVPVRCASSHWWC
jgi:hypothetical protein